MAVDYGPNHDTHPMTTLTQETESSPKPSASKERKGGGIPPLGTLIATVAVITGFMTYTVTRHADQATSNTQFLTVYSNIAEDLSTHPSNYAADIGMLQNLMQNFPGDQPLIAGELVDLVRTHASRADLIAESSLNPEAQVALTALIERNIRNDGKSVIDLSHLYLSKADFSGGQLAGVDLAYTNPQYADFDNANLVDADLQGSNLGGADLVGTNLSGANLVDANLGSSRLTNTKLTSADLAHANLGNAEISGSTTHADAACSGTHPNFPSFGYLCETSNP